MSARSLLDVALVAALLLVGWLAYRHFIAPAPGRALDFKITEASEDGPSRAAFVAAEVSIESGTLDDFAATAVAIATIVPEAAVIVSLERRDVPPSVGHWRRTLARAQYHQTDAKPLSVSTPEPLLSAREISASIEYSERAGLAVTNDGQLLSPEMDKALMTELAAKYGVSVERVGLFTPLRTERGKRGDWTILDGPGSRHIADLARCYAKAGHVGWKECR